MSLQLTVNLQGIPELQDKLNKMEAAGQKTTLVPAVEQGAEILRADAAQRAPRDSGALADNMTMDIVKQDRNYVSIKVGPDRKQWYGRLVENGTVYIPPQPFLAPALRANRERIMALIRGRILNAIGKV